MTRRWWLLFFIAFAGLSFLLWLRTQYPVQHPVQNSEQILVTSLARIRSGDFSGITKAIKELEQREDGAVPASILTAVLQLQTNHPDSALRSLLSLDQDGPYRNLILLTAGEALCRTGQTGQAERALMEVVQAEPANVDAHRWLGSVYFDLGANDRAIDELREVIRLAPDDYRPHHLLAIIYQDFEKYGLAAEQCREAVRLKMPPEKHQAVTLLLFQALTKLHSYEAALAVAADLPTSAELRVVKARCLWDLGRMDEARQVLSEALRCGDESPELSMIEANSWEQLGDPQRAEKILRHAVDRFPHEAQLRYVLGTFLQKSGQQDEARREMQIWQEKQRLRTLLTELNLKAVRDPHDPAVRDQLADVCRQLGKNELATMWESAASACRAAQQEVKQPAGVMKP